MTTGPGGDAGTGPPRIERFVISVLVGMVDAFRLIPRRRAVR